MQRDRSKAAIAAAQVSQKKPQTRVESLRVLLNNLQLRIVRLPQAHNEDALQIPVMLDQAADLLDEIQQSGGSASSEESLFETILAQFQKYRKAFLQRAGGAVALEKARQAHQPTADHWWWFVDETLAAERRQGIRRALIIGGISILVLAVLAVVYQKFLAPDPALQASIGYQTSAENFLTTGEYEEVLAQVELALQNTPDNPTLYVLQGLAYELLGEPELATKSYETAQKGFPNRDSFYAIRAGYYLMANQGELALADTDAAIAINPDSAVSFLRKAQAYEMLGEISKAIDTYELASDVASRIGNPQLEVMARMNLAQLLQMFPSPAETPTE